MDESVQLFSQHQKIYALRLKPHADLKKSIQAFAQANKIKAGVIISCVGSLEQYHLRLAHQENGAKRKGHFEILSLTGTFSDTALHLHLAIANSVGQTTGGHLLEENLIYTTAELALMDLTDLEFIREKDPTYGYPELVIKKKSGQP